MKIGLRVSFLKPEKSGEHPFEPALKFVSRLGLDGVELCLDPRSPWGDDFGAWSEDLTIEDRRRIVELCRSYGLNWPVYLLIGLGVTLDTVLSLNIGVEA